MDANAFDAQRIVTLLLRDVVKHQRHAAHRAVGPANNRAVGFDRRVRAIARHRHAAHRDLGFAVEVDERLNRVAAHLLARLVLAAEHVPQAVAPRVGERPAGDLLGHRVHSRHAAVGVGGDEAGTDAGQGDREALLAVEQTVFGMATLPRLGLERRDDRLQLAH